MKPIGTGTITLLNNAKKPFPEEVRDGDLSHNSTNMLNISVH